MSVIDYQPRISDKLADAAVSNGKKSKPHYYQQQEMIIPASLEHKYFSKKLLLTSDLANRFLFAVSQTERAHQRKINVQTSLVSMPFLLLKVVFFCRKKKQ